MKNNELARKILSGYIPEYAMPSEPRWFVHCWHGRNPKLLDELSTFCDYDAEDDTIYWFGSLDEFYRHWQGPILIKGDTINVTQFNDFGAR